MKKLLTLLLIVLTFNCLSQTTIIQTDVLATNIQQKEVTIYWRTNIPTKSVLYFGKTTTQSQMTIVYSDSIFSLDHKVVFNNLSLCTRYYYRIKSITSTNLAKISAAKVFDTGGCGVIKGSEDSIPPSVPSDLYATTVTPISFILKWKSSTDNVKIAGYRIWGSDKGIIATLKGTKTEYKIITKNGLKPSTLYQGEFGTTAGFMVQAYDTCGNFSGPSERLIVFIPDSSKKYYTLKNDGSDFSSFVNSSGNPIGGGEGYKFIVDINTVQYVVSTKISLLEAIQNAQPGQIIYVKDSSVIDLTGVSLKIPKGVTLASGRGNGNSQGALLYSNTLSPELAFNSMIETNGDSVRITGLRLKGPSCDIWDHDYNRGVANAIRCKNSNLEIDNCEIYDWNKWAIWLYISKNAYVHHNYIHHAILAGYGYGVWCGGAGSEVNSYALIESNIFEANRHAIASSGHVNSWEAKGNVFLRRQLYINLDRHNYNTETGGKSIKVEKNLFFSTQQHYGFASPRDSVNGFIEIKNNFFRRDSINAGVIDKSNYSPETQNSLIRIFDNYYSGKNQTLPTAIIYSDKDSGNVPLTVKFDGTGSYDINGIPIVRWVWRFADGDDKENEKRESNTTYNFTKPGVYNVTLIAYNAYGIPSNVKQKTIIVKPVTGKYILSAWIKDTYPDSLTGYYSKQILVDGEVIWEDDVAGNEGWQHIIIDISRFGIQGSTHKVGSRIISVNGVSDPENQICELYMWTDDFTVFNTTISNISFENDLATPWRQGFNIPLGGSGMSSAVTTEDCRGGDRSFRLRFIYNKIVAPGQYGEIYQNITFK